METVSLEKLGRFRQKVIRLCVIENKSIYETAIACGCTAEKVKRVLKKWKMTQNEARRRSLSAHQ